MLSIHLEQNIFFTIAEGNLTNEDYDRLFPLLEERIRSYGTIRWYFEIREFEIWSLSDLWKDLISDIRNRESFERIAVVGDLKWEKQLILLTKPFTDARVKYFDSSESDEAKNWIRKIEL